MKRMADANLNRAREGLRVVEDLFRFWRPAPFLSGRARQLRHELSDLFRAPRRDFVLFRESCLDPGRGAGIPGGESRSTPQATLYAAFSRAEEAARVLEEWCRLHSSKSVGAVEAIRYKIYELEGLAALRLRPLRGITKNRLYAILPDEDRRPVQVAKDLAGAGVRLFQVRSKTATSRRLLETVRAVRAAVGPSATLIVNDRVSVAGLAGDGVHLGEDDLPVREARQLLGPDKIIGATAHTREEAQRAIADGADYLGVGTVYPSTTRPDRRPTGVDWLRDLVASTSVPIFAIGGIGPENCAAVLETGAHGVAVGAALWRDLSHASLLLDLTGKKSSVAPVKSPGNSNG